MNRTTKKDLQIAMELDETQIQQLIVSVAHAVVLMLKHCLMVQTGCPYAI
jgi:hypothetical protein